MNQRVEIILETTVNERLYRVSLPWGAPYDDCFEVLRQFTNQVDSMKQISEQQQKDAEAQKADSTVDNLSTD